MKRQIHNVPCQILTAYIPCDIVNDIMTYIEANGMNRSEFVKKAILKMLEDKDK